MRKPNKRDFDNGDGTFDNEGYSDKMDEYGDISYQEMKDEKMEEAAEDFEKDIFKRVSLTLDEKTAMAAVVAGIETYEDNSGNLFGLQESIAIVQNIYLSAKTERGSDE